MSNGGVASLYSAFGVPQVELTASIVLSTY